MSTNINLHDFNQYFELERFSKFPNMLNQQSMAISTHQHLLLSSLPQAINASQDENNSFSNLKLAIEYKHNQDTKVSMLHWLDSDHILTGFESGLLMCHDISGKLLFQFTGSFSPVNSIRIMEDDKSIPQLFILYEEGLLLMVKVQDVLKGKFCDAIGFQLDQIENAHDFVLYGRPMINKDEWEDLDAIPSNYGLRIFVTGYNHAISIYDIDLQRTIKPIITQLDKNTTSNGMFSTKSLYNFMSAMAGMSHSPENGTNRKRTQENILEWNRNTRTIKLSPSNNFIDLKRRILRISLDPLFSLIVAADSLGRVLLYDLNTECFVRLWKGLRDAQLGWLIDQEEPHSMSRTNSSNSFQSFQQIPFDEASLQSNSIAPIQLQPSLKLIIFAPLLGLVSIYRMKNGPCIRVVPVGLNCRMSNIFNASFDDNFSLKTCSATICDSENKVLEIMPLGIGPQSESELALIAEMMSEQRLTLALENDGQGIIGHGLSLDDGDGEEDNNLKHTDMESSIRQALSNTKKKKFQDYVLQDELTRLLRLFPVSSKHQSLFHNSNRSNEAPDSTTNHLTIIEQNILKLLSSCHSVHQFLKCMSLIETYELNGFYAEPVVSQTSYAAHQNAHSFHITSSGTSSANSSTSTMSSSAQYLNSEWSIKSNSRKFSLAFHRRVNEIFAEQVQAFKQLELQHSTVDFQSGTPSTHSEHGQILLLLLMNELDTRQQLIKSYELLMELYEPLHQQLFPRTSHPHLKDEITVLCRHNNYRAEAICWLLREIKRQESKIYKNNHETKDSTLGRKSLSPTNMSSGRGNLPGFFQQSASGTVSPMYPPIGSPTVMSPRPTTSGYMSPSPMPAGDHDTSPLSPNSKRFAHVRMTPLSTASLTPPSTSMMKDDDLSLNHIISSSVDSINFSLFRLFHSSILNSLIPLDISHESDPIHRNEEKREENFIALEDLLESLLNPCSQILIYNATNLSSLSHYLSQQNSTSVLPKRPENISLEQYLLVQCYQSLSLQTSFSSSQKHFRSDVQVYQLPKSVCYDLLALLFRPLLGDLVTYHSFNNAMKYSSSSFSSPLGWKNILIGMFYLMSKLSLHTLVNEILTKQISTLPFQRWLRDNLLLFQEMYSRYNSYIHYIQNKKITNDIKSDSEEDIADLISPEEVSLMEGIIQLAFSQEATSPSNHPTELPSFDQLAKIILDPSLQECRYSTQLECVNTFVSVVLETLQGVHDQIERRSYGKDNLSTTIANWEQVIKQSRVILFLKSRFLKESSTFSSFPLPNYTIDNFSQGNMSIFYMLAFDTLEFVTKADQAIEHEQRCREAYHTRSSMVRLSSDDQSGTVPESTLSQSNATIGSKPAEVLLAWGPIADKRWRDLISVAMNEDANEKDEKLQPSSSNSNKTNATAPGLPRTGSHHLLRRRKKPLLLYFPDHNQQIPLSSYRAIIFAERWTTKLHQLDLLTLSIEHLNDLPSEWKAVVAHEIYLSHVFPVLQTLLSLEENSSENQSTLTQSNPQEILWKSHMIAMMADPMLIKRFVQLIVDIIVLILPVLNEAGIGTNVAKNSLMAVDPSMVSSLNVLGGANNRTYSREEPSKSRDTLSNFNINDYSYRENINDGNWPSIVDPRLTRLYQTFFSLPSTTAISLPFSSNVTSDAMCWSQAGLIDQKAIAWVIQLRFICALRGIKCSQLFGPSFLSFLSYNKQTEGLELNKLKLDHERDNQIELQCTRIEFLAQCLKSPKYINDSLPLLYELSSYWSIDADVIRILHARNVMDRNDEENALENLINKFQDQEINLDLLISHCRVRLGLMILRIEKMPKFGPLLASLDAEALIWIKKSTVNYLSSMSPMTSVISVTDLNFVKRLVLLTQNLLLAIPYKDRQISRPTFVHEWETYPLIQSFNLVRQSNWLERKSRCDALLSVCNAMIPVISSSTAVSSPTKKK